jgi:hypothetical protein
METLIKDGVPGDTVDFGDYAPDAYDRDQVDRAVYKLHALLDDLPYPVDKYEWHSEVFLDPAEHYGGTIDLVGVYVHEDDYTQSHAIAIDYKFGSVEQDAKSQLCFYMGCAMRTGLVPPETRDFTLATIQPAIPSGGYTHEVTAVDIHMLMTAHAQAMELALSPEASSYANAGMHCKFCPAEATCPARMSSLEKAMQRQLSAGEAGHGLALSKALAKLDEVKNWVKAVEAQTLAALESDIPVPGYKLVRRQGRRTWIEGAEEKLCELVDNPYDKKLLSPAQVEKLIPKKDARLTLIKELQFTPETGVTYAPLSDKRPAVSRELSDDVKSKLRKS